MIERVKVGRVLALVPERRNALMISSRESFSPISVDHATSLHNRSSISQVASGGQSHRAASSTIVNSSLFEQSVVSLKHYHVQYSCSTP